MGALAETSLSTAERVLLDRFVDALRQDARIALHAVWLFGSRARGEVPEHDDSDVDVLVLVDDATWGGKELVHAALDTAARGRAGAGGSAPMALGAHQHPQWLAQRREIRSFFIAEVDRDKVVLAGPR